MTKIERGKECPVPVYEARIIRKDGTVCWIEFRTVPIEYEGYRAVLGNLIDITQNKERELELLRGNRELVAINRLLMRTIQPCDDIEKDLGDFLTDVISGFDQADVGGIFLLEGGSLVLRSLSGLVEDLIHFLGCTESSLLLNAPKINCFEDGSKYIWISAPIICRDQAIGVIVVALLSGDSNRSISFLESAARHIGRLLEICSLSSSAHTLSGEQLIEQAQSGKTRDFKQEID